ncbi:MAG: hypothetical protein M0Z69_11570 [Actinomycetota bacterium]|nr:hypothetical protein [Actinomycetota bacterium]
MRVLHADLVHEGLEQRLHLGWGAASHRCLDLASKASDARWVGCLERLLLERAGQLPLALAELACPLPEGAHPWPADLLGKASSLEAREVTVDRRLDLGQLATDGLELALDEVLACRHPLVCPPHRLLDERAVGEHLQEALHDRLVEHVCGKARGRAGGRAVALAGAAGVVAVGAVPPGRSRAGEARPAGTDDKAREQVVRGVRGPLRGVLAPLVEEALGRIEHRRVDEGRVRALVPLAAPADLAQIDAVAKDREHRLEREGPPRSRLVPGRVQPGRDLMRARQLMHVPVEDPRHEGRLGLLDEKTPALWGAPVAEGLRAADPAPLGGLSPHPHHDPLDDRGPLELGEDAEHLHHHPPRRRRRLEGLGGRAEADAGRVEAGEQLREQPHRATEPVDSVDEQDVETTESRVGERPAKPGALELRP